MLIPDRMSQGSLSKKIKICDDVIEDHYFVYAQGIQMDVVWATLILTFFNMSAWLSHLSNFLIQFSG